MDAADGADVVVEQVAARAVVGRALPQEVIAMPTLVAQPVPSGPVVVSTPAVQRYFRVARGLGVELSDPAQVIEENDGSPSVS